MGLVMITAVRLTVLFTIVSEPLSDLVCSSAECVLTTTCGCCCYIKNTFSYTPIQNILNFINIKINLYNQS